MIQRIVVSLRVTPHPGQLVDPEDLVHQLNIDLSDMDLAGEAGPGKPGGIVMMDRELAGFEGEDRHEKYDNFVYAIQSDIYGLSHWLSDMEYKRLADVKRSNKSVDVLIDLFTDIDDFEFTLAPEFTAELGRLELPLTLLSHG